ncbi:MAG: glycerol kinase GlpK [Deltaproteobacteria bacterium]|nr:glycerol kinase GlpK [Deltaproteobacteria bacterium]
MARYILAIDQGTTSSRAIVIDADLRVLGTAQAEFPQQYPQPGWVEHDPEAIWRSVTRVIAAAIRAARIDPKSIAGIGITNQRETTILWDRETGVSVHNAIVWQDRRTAERCETLRREGKEPLVTERSGLVLDPYFSGTKIAWLLDHVPNARKRAAKGELAFGTIDTFLAWRLTGGTAHVTDVSNAARTLCLNLASCAWDDALCELLCVEPSLLPRVVSSSEIVGATRGLDVLPDGIPIAGMAGDQQAALFGQACFAPGEAKCTYGTGSFLLMNTGERPIRSRRRLLSTVAWRLNGRTTYALEGSCFIAGAAVQWLRDGLKLIASAREIEALAASVPDSGGVTFVPALAGLGAPHWRAEARGLIGGITRGTTAAHLARATLEGIALQQCDLLHAMREESGIPLKTLKVDGGAAANNLLMQIQADLLGIDLIRPQQLETTVIGAACLAGLATDVWKSPEDIRQHWQEDRRFVPRLDDAARRQRLIQWQSAVAKA